MTMHAHLLAVEIADHCKDLLTDVPDWPVFETLHDPGGGIRRRKTVSRDHLLWMANEIHDKSEEWPATKLHRWVGFMQGTLVSYAMTTIDQESEKVRLIKNVFLEEMDLELQDHQDLESHFELELGGES